MYEVTNLLTIEYRMIRLKIEFRKKSVDNQVTFNIVRKSKTERCILESFLGQVRAPILSGVLMQMTRMLSVYSGNGKFASWAAIVGFLVMMSLDVGLG